MLTLGCFTQIWRIVSIEVEIAQKQYSVQPFTDEAYTALLKDPVRTALKTL
jgi:hypothetical protein